MNFLELASKRYSVRNYQNRPVEKEKLLYVLEAARLAPSAVNFQPWQFVVLTEADQLKAVVDIYPREWVKTAPVIIMALGDHELGWHRKSDGKDYTDVDIALAIDHLMLAAAEQSLGTCWICNFDFNKCCKIFNIPENLEPIAFIAIGYPEEQEIPEKKRKSLNQLVRWERL
jgi:nitroreductase